MATLHAGLKRDFQTMNAHSSQSQGFKASPEHRNGTRTPARSRESSLGPQMLNGTNHDIGSQYRKINFDQDASILLIGVRGTGKSSLGFLAASAYSRRLVESERAFLDATGVSPSSYRKAHGNPEYHAKHSEILRQVLHTHDKNAVIVCNFSDLENEGTKLIQTFGQSHPVIYVTRDPRGIQSYLRVWSTERIRDLSRASEPLLRSCSNYEFFNLSESQDQTTRTAAEDSSVRPSHGPSLTLKRTERDFLKLLRNIIGDHDRSRSHQSAYPLSQISIETLDYTSAVVVTAEEIVGKEVDLDTAQIGADAVELQVTTHRRRGDASNSGRHGCFNLAAEAFAELKRSTILPIIMTVNDSNVAPEQCSSVDLLEFCFRLGPDYCTVDLALEESRFRRLMANKGRTKIIGSACTTREAALGGPNKHLILSDIYEQARRYCCDVAKITLHTDEMGDVFVMASFQHMISEKFGDAAPRLIAYCTGGPSLTSMCFNKVLTSVVPPAPENSRLRDPIEGKRDHIEGGRSLTAKARNLALFNSFIHEPLRFLIYGANVSFSLSPAMHNAAYEACGMLHRYRTHSACTLDDLVALVREPDFGGAAIVQPFKTTTLAMMDVLSPHAKAIGALNTIIPLREAPVLQRGILCGRNRTGPVKALYGDNTDWIGIRACIRRGLSPANTVRPYSTGLVCGAGGMARAAIYAMISLGVQTIFVCNRTHERTEELAEHYNRLIQAKAIVELDPNAAASTTVVALKSFESEWPRDARHPTMIVSCIPTQSSDSKPTDFVLPREWLSSRTGGVVVELAYMPIVTPLVKQIRNENRKGWILMDGLDMLPEQAFAQFELFTGRRAPRKLMRDQVFQHYSEDDFPPHGALNTDSPRAD